MTSTPFSLRLKRGARITLKIFLYVILTVIVLFFVAHEAVNIFVSSNDISVLIKDIVQRETGGKLEIQEVKFGAFSGLSLYGVKFFPPLPGDKRGFVNGGDVTQEPLANVKEVALKYRFWTVFVGMIRINAVQVVNPDIQLKDQDGVMNFSGILDYRKEHFPVVTQEPLSEEPPKTSEEAKGELRLSSLVPISPKFLILPLSIKVRNVGVQNLLLDLKKFKKDTLISHTSLKGPSVDVGLSIFTNTSRLAVTVKGGAQDEIEFFVDDLDAATKKSTEQKMTRKMYVRSAIVLQIAVEDLQRLKIDLDGKLHEIQGNGLSYKDRTAKLAFDLRLLDHLSGLRLENLDVNLMNALIYHFRGEVLFPKDNLDEIILDLKQDFKLSIDEAVSLAAPFVPGLEGSGLIALDKFEVKGKVVPAHYKKGMEPKIGKTSLSESLKKKEGQAEGEEKSEKLGEQKQEKEFPRISALLNINGVTLNLHKQGLSLGPLSGTVALAGGASLLGSGPEIEAAVNLLLEKLRVKQNTPVGDVEVTINGFTTNLTAKILYPELMVPVFKFNVEAEHIKTHGPNVSELDVPLFVSVDADSGKSLERFGAAARFELGDLVEISAVGDCKNFCEKFRANAAVRLAALNDLFAIVVPLSGKLGLAKVLPSRLEGAVDLQLLAKGTIPDPRKGDVGAILKKGSVYFNTQLNMADVGVTLPNIVELDKLNTRLSLTGDLREQKLSLTKNFKKFALLGAPEKEGAAPVTKVELKRMSTEVSVVNQIAPTFDLKNPLQGITTSIDSRFYIGKTVVESAGQTLTDIEFGVKATQAKMSDINLAEAFVFVPNFGARVTVDAKTKLTEKFMPSSFGAGLKLVVDHTSSKKLPGGVQTTGNLGLNFRAWSQDMKVARLSGDANFDKFSVTIPGKAPDQPAVLVVENINGKIPFAQQVDIPSLEKSTPEAQAAKPAAATAAGTKDKEIAEDVLAEEKFEKAVEKYKEKNKSYFKDSTNMVTLVDYGNVRPFYPKKQPLSIEKLSVANLDFSNMEFDLELKQNWFALNQFVINFLGGKIQGDLQLAFEIKPDSPKDSPQALRTSIHLTRLNSQKLIDNFPKLKERATSWSLLSDPYIDGTIHFNFDFKSRDMSGGIEITSIGREQLKMILYYVDPQERDPNIRNIRNALNIGEIRNVSVPLKNGLIGIDVDVRLLSAPIPTPKIQRFPISQLVGNFMEGGDKEAPKAPQSGSVPTEKAIQPTQPTPPTKTPKEASSGESKKKA